MNSPPPYPRLRRRLEDDRKLADLPKVVFGALGFVLAVARWRRVECEIVSKTSAGISPAADWKGRSMPRYTNAADGSLILHFGQGDIAVCTGRYGATDPSNPDHREDELVFVVHQEPHEIGSSAANLKGMRSDQLDTALRLVFDNVASLDVVIGQLLRLRGGFPDAPPFKVAGGA